jgi:hypothetical protein
MPVMGTSGVTFTGTWTFTLNGDRNVYIRYVYP